ncbi:MAG: S-layer homology domain-containing protein [Candidatus Heteroscillospira sp.]|jgi:hypothetical protein
MKKSKFSKLLALALVVVLVIGAVAVTALADEPATVTYDHSKQQFVFNPDTPYNDVDGHKYPDLFTAMKELMPGDTVSQTITVKATGMSGSDYAEIRLRTEPMHETDLPVAPSPVPGETPAVPESDHDGITEEEAETYKLLAEKLNLTVTKGSGETAEVLSDAVLSEGVALAKLKNNETVELTVTLTVPMDTGNELAGLRGVIGWVFTAEHFHKGGGGGGTDIPDEPIPEGPTLTTDHFAYVIGRDDGLVHPEAEITRAEVTTIFFRMLTDESRGDFWSQMNDYSDVFSTSWYNNAISTMTEAKVVTGYPDGSFKPNGSITRAEFAAMLSRFFDTEYEGEDLFSDISGHWAADLINNAAMNGLIEGYPDGTYRPNNYITRAEAITGINRILGRAPEKSHLLDDMIKWPDNADTEKWYYAAVQEATNSHDYEMVTGGVENWTKLLEVRDWTALEREWSEANSTENPGEVVSSADSSKY